MIMQPDPQDWSDGYTVPPAPPDEYDRMVADFLAWAECPGYPLDELGQVIRDDAEWQEWRAWQAADERRYWQMMGLDTQGDYWT